MVIDYNLMKKRGEPFFELTVNNDIALHINHLIFTGEDGLLEFRKYGIKKVKNIQDTMKVLELSEEDIFLLTDEKFKYETVAFQFDNMLEDLSIRKNFISYENKNLLKVKNEKRFKKETSVSE